MAAHGREYAVKYVRSRNPHLQQRWTWPEKPCNSPPTSLDTARETPLHYWIWPENPRAAYTWTSRVLIVDTCIPRPLLMTFMFLLHRPHVYFLSHDFVIICDVIIEFLMSSLNFVAWIMEHELYATPARHPSSLPWQICAATL